MSKRRWNDSGMRSQVVARSSTQAVFESSTTLPVLAGNIAAYFAPSHVPYE